MKNKINKAGYTIIEILVVITITGLIFGIGYIGFRDFSRRQLVNSTVRQLKGDMKLAQEQALSGKKPVSCNGVLDGYKFTISGSSNSYEVSADCSLDDVVIKTVSVPTEMSITEQTVNPIIFKALGQGTNIPEGGSEIITVSHKSMNYSLSLTVGAGGEIQ